MSNYESFQALVEEVVASGDETRQTRFLLTYKLHCTPAALLALVQYLSKPEEKRAALREENPDLLPLSTLSSYSEKERKAMYAVVCSEHWSWGVGWCAILVLILVECTLWPRY